MATLTNKEIIHELNVNYDSDKGIITWGYSVFAAVIIKSEGVKRSTFRISKTEICT